MRTLLAFCFFLLVACTDQSRPADIKISTLETGQTFVMDIHACHWGCTKGKVSISGRTAIYKDRSIILTDKEIDDLDAYLTLGRPESEGWRCSLPILISLKKTQGWHVIANKDEEIYPCGIAHEEDDHSGITPLGLADFLLDDSDLEPLWRNPDQAIRLVE